MIEDLATALRSAYPELEEVAAAAGEQPVYLVGGAVRDLLLGRARGDIDLVVVGDAVTLATRLGADVVEHERFATAKARLDGHEIDIASARAEAYPQPGALPVVEPAADLEADLARRDFTINAMAIPLQGDRELVDPHGGRADLDAGLLRILHRGSFEDDPTRALRAARYAARFGFEVEPKTLALLRAAEIGTVSADRRQADLLRLAAEPEPARGFRLLAEWGLVEVRPGGIELARRVADLLSSPPWREAAPRAATVLRAALGPPGGEEDLAATHPERPSEGVEWARRHDPVELALARAQGAEWLDEYLLEWSTVSLEIGGEDLIAAGIPQGPAVGRGLHRALHRKLDGEIEGRQHELEAALAAARGDDGLA